MSIPPRWLNCPRKSAVIAEKFLAFKTFLGPQYDDQVPEANQYHVPMLLTYLESLQIKLGLIIDLTNTNRFYDRKDVDSAGINYVKLHCRGHGETPSREQTQLFFNICDRFWGNNPNQLIGVHCTHGFNRTGFMIISYLVEKMDWSLEAAVGCFSKCRQPGIYKQDYLNELNKRYSDPNEPLHAPERPDWCFEDEASDEEDDAESSDSKGQMVDGSRDGRWKRRKRDPRVKEAKFVEGIHGVEVMHSPKREEIEDICERICDWHKGGFPGSQPVSMDKQNIQLLAKKPYRVSWKADGVRYMMLILGEGEVYMVDRDNAVFKAPQFRFPQRKNPKEHVFDTLLDGEMVFDKEGERTYPRYLVYDVVRFQGQDVGKTSHDTRMLCIKKEIEMPRNQAVQEGTLDKSKEPFSIRAKDFFPVERTAWILDHWVTKLTHENDGLIFNPAEEPYTAGQCVDLLKWKPHTLNSVDFILNIVTERKEGCLPEIVGCLMVGGFERPFATMKVNKDLKAHHKKVIECTWNGRQWVFLRVREDKSFPNSYQTASSVCESIRNPITKERLIEIIEKYRFRRPAPTQGGHTENSRHT